MSQLSIKKQIYIALATTLFLGGFIISTNPRQLPAAFFLVPVGMLFLILFAVLRLLLVRLLQISNEKVKILAATLAAGPTLLLMLASIGQLTIRDSLLSFIFIGGLAWYFKHRYTAETY